MVKEIYDLESKKNKFLKQNLSKAIKELSFNNQKKLYDLISNFDNFIKTNKFINEKFGIINFFPDEASYNMLLCLLKDTKNTIMVKENIQKELGDFQTPKYLTDGICEYLKNNKVKPTKIVEPTFGEGNFIISALNKFENVKLIYGVEIQGNYIWKTKFKILDEYLSGRLSNKHKTKVKLIKDNIFTHTFSDLFIEDDNILILGNPPWATNSNLTYNLPKKNNFKSHSGIDAITGSSNFDICESIILLLLQKFSNFPGKFTMLCKNTVIKNLINDLQDYDFCIDNMVMQKINTKKIFDASASSSIFFADLGKKSDKFVCKSKEWDSSQKKINHFGWINNNFVSNVDKYEMINKIEGKSQLTWRQGLKHDCSKVMQLEKTKNGYYKNKKDSNEKYKLDEDLIYGLLKSSDLKNLINEDVRKYVIVPQKNVGQDTKYIKEKYKRTWDYLNKYREDLDSRKSTIYKGKPPFSIFGIGDYSFKKYKIAISGFYKKANFSLALPINNKPVMLDDTCYFLGFNKIKYAVILTALLNSEIVQEFLKSIAFLDSKRPYTKKILMRIDLKKLVDLFNFKRSKDELKKNNLINNLAQIEKITKRDYLDFKENIYKVKNSSKQPSLFD